MPDPADCVRLARRCGGRGCRSWSWPHPGGRAAPGRCGCRVRVPEVGGEGMPEGVAAGTLVDAGGADGAGHGALDIRLVVVMPALGGLALSSARGGKDPLPTPVTRRGREFPVDCIRQPDPAETGGQVFLMQRGRANELFAQLCTDTGRKHRHAVMLPFRVAYGHLPTRNVDIYGAAARTEPQARTAHST